MDVHHISALASIALYLTTSYMLWQQLRGHEASRTLTLLPALLALTTHAIALGGSMSHGDQLNLNVANAFSMTSWTTSLLLLISTLAMKTEVLGLAVFPFTAFTLAFELLSPDQPQILNATAGLTTHILTSILAYGVLTMAAVQAGLVAFQHHALRSHQPTGFFRALPPMATMENLLFEFIAAGLALLTLSLVSGALFVENLFAQHLVHKTVLSIVAWLVFATLLTGRFRLGWRGPKAVRWTLSGFSLLVVGYFGSKIVLEFILR